MVCIFPHSDQNNSEQGHFSRNECCSLIQSATSTFNDNKGIDNFDEGNANLTTPAKDVNLNAAKLKDGCGSLHHTFSTVKEINSFEVENADLATGTSYFSFHAEKLKEHCKHSNISYLIMSR